MVNDSNLLRGPTVSLGYCFLFNVNLVIVSFDGLNSSQRHDESSSDSVQSIFIAKPCIK